MKLLSVDASDGAAWVRRGFQVFFRQPLAFSGVFAAFLFVVFGLTLVPLLGPLLLLALLPLGSLGFMIATRDSLQGRQPSPRAFVDPLRHGRAATIAMVRLGLIYAACSLGIIWLSDAVDGGALEVLMETLSNGKSSTDDVRRALSDPKLEAGVLLRFGLAAALSVPYWHAPALVHWAGQGVAQALFSSTVACWRNKGAFVVFALVWFAIVLGFALLANLVGALLGTPQFVALAAVPATLLLSTVFYASIWFSFAACFELSDPAPAPEPATEDPS
ncbi:MAG: hypothetical protein KF788_13465 [Piscinibacter sp.]|nr:hypothetical protein [Piscinibacter sp.]